MEIINDFNFLLTKKLWLLYSHSVSVSLDKLYNYSSVAAQLACTLASCDVADVSLATAVSSGSFRQTPEQAEVVNVLFIVCSSAKKLCACQKI